MKKFVRAVIAVIIFAGILGIVFTAAPSGVASAEAEYVYVGGTPIGIAIGTDGLIVIGSSQVVTEHGNVNPMEGSGVVKGDVITGVDGAPVSTLYELKNAVGKAGNTVRLTVRRGGQIFERDVDTAIDMFSGIKKIGIIVKEDIGGVGTLTFVTEKGRFAALGHHIADPESGLKQELNKGKIYPVEVSGVIKGEKGRAGGLQATVNRLQNPLGEINANTNIGLYGVYTDEPRGQRIRVAGAGEAKMGRAQVLTTVNGTEPRLYDIDIVKVVSQSGTGEKGLVLSVRDAELLDRAGGIVQGMSGSPIIQNGTLVGAVTHVFVSDPTRGYGVHARFMLEKAEQTAA